MNVVSIYENFIVGQGAWGLSIVFLTMITLLVLIFIKNSDNLTILRFSVTTFVPIMIISAYLRGGAYRIGPGDSFNRMFIQIVPIVILFIILSVALGEFRYAKYIGKIKNISDKKKQFVKPFSILIIIAIIINFVQIKDIDNHENYDSEALRSEMFFMKALYIEHEPDLFRTAVRKSTYWAGIYGIYVAIGSVSNNTRIIIPEIDRVILNFYAFHAAISDVHVVEFLNYDPITFFNGKSDLNDINSLVISNEQFNYSRHYKILINPYNDYIKELIVLIEDGVLILLDTSLLSYEDHNRIEELRE